MGGGDRSRSNGHGPSVPPRSRRISSANEAVTDVHQLVEATSLFWTNVFQQSATRRLDVAPIDDFEVDPRFTITADFRDDGSGFRVLLLTAIETPIGPIACGVLADYEHPDARLGPELSKAFNEYVTGVALMHIIPFVRQSISDLTVRVFGSPLLMPVLQRGQMQFTLRIEQNW